MLALNKVQSDRFRCESLLDIPILAEGATAYGGDSRGIAGFVDRSDLRAIEI